MNNQNGKIISTHRTEKEFWDIVNTPIEVTKEELQETNEPVDMKALQKSIEEDGMGYITYAQNHRDNK